MRPTLSRKPVDKMSRQELKEELATVNSRIRTFNTCLKASEARKLEIEKRLRTRNLVLVTGEYFEQAQ